MTRHFKFLTLLLLLSYSCSNDPRIYATKWTNDIKQKILIDAQVIPDSSYFDTVGLSLWFYKFGKKVKTYHFQRLLDHQGKLYLDTSKAVITYYSKDGNFELVTSRCAPGNGGFESVRYKYYFYGQTEFRFCNGKIREKGFRFYNKDVGTWVTYDSAGNVINTVDYGSNNLLNKLKEIHYNP